MVGLLVGCLATAGCATAFGYKSYGLEVASFEGKLLGPDVSQDLPFASCAPQPGKAKPCMVVFSDEWFRLKADFLLVEDQLKRCQQGTKLE